MPWTHDLRASDHKCASSFLFHTILIYPSTPLHPHSGTQVLLTYRLDLLIPLLFCGIVCPPSSMEISLGQKPCHMFLSSQILHFPALCSAVLGIRETPKRPELSQVPFKHLGLHLDVKREVLQYYEGRDDASKKLPQFPQDTCF